MWLLYNRFTVSRKIDDPSDKDLVDEIGEICYQWATSRDCFSHTPKFSKWKAGMKRAWPSSESLPRLTVEDRTTDSPLDWIDLPDYFCEFRDLRLTLEQNGDIQDIDSIFIHHIHIKRIDEAIEFSILQDMPTDEDNRDWEEIEGIYPPKLFNEIINNYDCGIKEYKIKNTYFKTNSSKKIEKNIFDRKRRLPLILIPEVFHGKKLKIEEISKFYNKIVGFGELWVYEGVDFYQKFQSNITDDDKFAIIYSPDLNEINLLKSKIGKKIMPIAYNDNFLNTSSDISNEIMRRTRSMKMRSELSIKVENAISEKERNIEAAKNQNKIEEIVNKNNTFEEKNNALIVSLSEMSNQIIKNNHNINKLLREKEKLNIQKEGFMKKSAKYRKKYYEIKHFRDEIESKAIELGLSVSETKEKIRMAFEEDEEEISQEIEYSSIFELVEDSKSRYPDIIFSRQALRSAKNADNLGAYDQDSIQKIKEVLKKLNTHFFENKDSNDNTKFNEEMCDLFPGKYSNESVETLKRIHKYKGNDRRIFPVSLPEKGELGIEMTWHIKPTDTFRIHIYYMKYGHWDIPMWENRNGRWHRNHKKEKGTTLGSSRSDYPKIFIGYFGYHLKTFKSEKQS